MAVFKASSGKRDITVLLAEDESMIRELISTYLADRGLTVLEAQNGREALERARDARATSIGLLVTDLVMPVVGGLELASEMRKLYPELSVLFISGYTDDVLMFEGGANNRTAFLRKPFSFEALGAKVEALLSASIPGAGRKSGTGAG